MADDKTPGPQNTAVASEEFSRFRYVSQATGSDSKGVGTKSNPWKTLQKALTDTPKSSAESRSAILVAEGFYSGREIQMREHVELYGGFDPISWDRDISRYPSILSGENSRRIILGANYTRLDGFVIRDARVRGDGAALYCKGTSPTVTNNRFQNNQTLAPEDWAPGKLHEKAHDGGAICACQGAAPTIANNLFVENRTEIGRGAAIALYSNCEGVIRENVFLHNETGTADGHRSSDGGAVSVFDWSKPRIEQNLFIENQALAVNDGGALFVALWSSPAIVGNRFVGNKSADDGGALFIGGQEHRYDREFDPLPNAKDYFVLVKNNLLCGNSNPKRNSGGIRMTMQSRAELVNNILAEKDQLYIQASEVDLTNNTFLEDMILIEFTSQLAPRLIVNNIMWGKLVYDWETPITSSNVRDGYPGQGNFDAKPKLDQEQKQLVVTKANFDSDRHVTTLEIAESNWDKNELSGRIVESDKRWTIVKSNDANQLVLWGDLSYLDQVNLLPTYRLRPQSPCIDRGSDQHAPQTDIDGDLRPLGLSADIGADEFVP
ncbi:right-handed parallel beta-helix repeat-containing protein [Bythopirellula goksoeyrii]|nr:right-handed parallel beta-helix repeat-containing protein [Bythopirellula goksoeyrii]